MHLSTDTRSANEHFAKVPTISHSRNAFSIAVKHVTTCQFDYLFPVYQKYIYPGDTLAITHAVMARLATQAAPLYDDLYVDMHAWFVPMRLIQTNWARFQFNAQPTGPTQDNSALTTPRITLSGLGAGGFTSKSLYDYFGFPTKINYSADTENINNYLGRAYNLIWNENYRDQNLQNAVVVDLDDGPDNPTDYVLLKRGKRFDKFTSCLTAQQKGTAVTIPLGTSAPVVGISQLKLTNSTPTTRGLLQGSVGGGYNNMLSMDGADLGAGTKNVQLAASASGVIADLSTATSATLNQLRTSYAIQHLLEADARGGTRDVESIQHRWGVTVPDFRLQRPEYLGGSTFTFDGHIVPQTSATGLTGGTTPAANLTQFSQGMAKLNVSHSFVEHGVFMILLSARSNITYQEGLPREYSYRTRYDFYQPEFANIGEVAVLNKEIYAQGTSEDAQTFGYQEYGYELRYGDNRVSGEMRSNYTTSLDSRHMADDYSALPTLGSAWIPSNTAISRNTVVSAATADPIQLNMLTAGKIARTLPMYSIPGLRKL
nr:MAG: major capsid protein [Microvirus sp.]